MNLRPPVRLSDGIRIVLVSAAASIAFALLLEWL